MNSRLKPLTTARTLLAATLASMIGAVTAADVRTPVEPVVIDGGVKIIDAVDAEKLSANVVVAADRGGAVLIDLIVTYKNPPRMLASIQVDALGGDTLGDYRKLRMRRLRLPAEKIRELAKDKNVATIAINEPVSALSASALETAQQPAPGSTYDFPVSAGVGVAVIDSGVGTHGDLNVVERVEMVAAADCSASGCDPNDPLGHGTHVAGIIGGDGYHSNQAYTGVAPGASIYSVRVLDANGSGQSSDVIGSLCHWCQCMSMLTIAHWYGFPWMTV